MTNSALSKKETQKLQRAIVDGLESVKAQDIRVFDTEHLSSLFERVVVASGTSNRQTKALSSSVIESIRAAGFPKPRVEGERNGEWVIVDCGQAVVHIMQPMFRQYYNLEELWGEKPVRLKLGVAKPIIQKVKLISAKESTLKSIDNLRRSNAAKIGVQEAFPSKAQLKKLKVVGAPIKKSSTIKNNTTIEKIPASVSKSKLAKTVPKSTTAKKPIKPLKLKS
mgnify:FL=1